MRALRVNRTGAAQPVVLDISKDFVRLWNAGLLHKLKSYEISGPVFDLILSLYHLRDRRHRVVHDVKSLQEHPASSGLPHSNKYQVNYGVPQGSILIPTLFLLCINELTDDGICNIAVYIHDATFYLKCYQASDLWQQVELAPELESDLRDMVN